MQNALYPGVFRVTRLTDNWQVINQTKRYGPYATHCQAALAAMVLAEGAADCSAGMKVVLEQDAAPPRVLWAMSSPRTGPA